MHVYTEFSVAHKPLSCAFWGVLPEPSQPVKVGPVWKTQRSGIKTFHYVKSRHFLGGINSFLHLFYPLSTHKHSHSDLGAT